MNDSTAPRPLYDALTTLAETPDDVSSINEALVWIASLVAALVSPVDYASVTAQRTGVLTTVATTHETALAVDEAQYAEQSGPCLDALEQGIPLAADIATTMTWPGFRAAAHSLGLQASLSIPLFAGSGHPIAALNLYARDATALAPLTKAMVTIFDAHQHEMPGEASEDRSHRWMLDAGSAQLLSGVDEALAIQQQIQVAIGILMQRERLTADAAYLMLRDRAASSGSTFREVAAAVVARITQE
jgi:hypothetical protein